MKVLNVLAVFALSLATVGADERLRLHVSHSTALAPADILVQAIVEPATDNGSLEVIAESDDFYRSSTVQLHGQQGPRVNAFAFAQMPAGFYEVTVRVLSSNGSEVASAKDSVIVG